MTPVILLTDGYLANASEPWRLPDLAEQTPFPVGFRTDAAQFAPFQRDPDTLARPWVRPGTPGLAHRVGGLEKADGSGHISYDPDNHQRMTTLREQKIRRLADAIPAQHVALGPQRGRLAVVGWGSTYGALTAATERARARGRDVSLIHLRHLWPLPANLGELLGGFERILVPELNAGQLARLLRAEYALPIESVGKVTGQPFKIAEIDAAIERLEESP